MEKTTNSKMPRIFSWLGFSFSVVCFALVWASIIISLSFVDYLPLCEAINSIGWIFGILGLGVSIVCLIISIKNSEKKLPSILGIVIVAITVISLVLSYLYLCHALKEELLKIELPNPAKAENSYQHKDSGIVINIGKEGEINFYAPGSEEPVAITDDDVYALKSQLDACNYDFDSIIYIKCDRETKYESIIKVLDNLSILNVKMYQIINHAPQEDD